MNFGNVVQEISTYFKQGCQFLSSAWSENYSLQLFYSLFLRLSTLFVISFSKLNYTGNPRHIVKFKSRPIGPIYTFN